MSKSIQYTIELYKADKRIKKDDPYGKNKVGLRYTRSVEFTCTPKEIESLAWGYRTMEFITHVFETYVTRKNLITGKEFRERYDTPYYCSPSSETYWSN